jgi:hypothetical protein
VPLAGRPIRGRSTGHADGPSAIDRVELRLLGLREHSSARRRSRTSRTGRRTRTGGGTTSRRPCTHARRHLLQLPRRSGTANNADLIKPPQDVPTCHGPRSPNSPHRDNSGTTHHQPSSAGSQCLGCRIRRSRRSWRTSTCGATFRFISPVTTVR